MNWERRHLKTDLVRIWSWSSSARTAMLCCRSRSRSHISTNACCGSSGLQPTLRENRQFSHQKYKEPLVLSSR